MAQLDFDARAATWDDDPAKIARAAAVAAAMRRRLDLSRRPRALEYGAGTGLLSFELASELGPTVLADSARGMLEVAERKIAARGLERFSTLALDLTVEALPGQEFDLIYSMMTLHHVPDTAAIVAAWRRLLAPGGAIAIADLDLEDGSFHGASVDVHHGFERGRLGEILSAAGFDRIAFDTCFEIERHGRRFSVFLATASVADT